MKAYNKRIFFRKKVSSCSATDFHYESFTLFNHMKAFIFTPNLSLPTYFIENKRRADRLYGGKFDCKKKIDLLPLSH